MCQRWIRFLHRNRNTISSRCALLAVTYCYMCCNGVTAYDSANSGPYHRGVLTSQAQAGSIAVVGSINVDLIAHVRRHPRPGETLHGSGGQTLPGGKGANQAVAAAR